VIYLLVCLVSGVVGAVVASRKGSSFPVWFIVSAVIPVLGVLAALLYRRESEVPLRRCPTCGAYARIYDAMCMSCGTDLAYPEQAEIIEPDPSLRVRAKL
jgi:ribosomal protein L32